MASGSGRPSTRGICEALKIATLLREALQNLDGCDPALAHVTTE